MARPSMTRDGTIRKGPQSGAGPIAANVCLRRPWSRPLTTRSGRLEGLLSALQGHLCADDSVIQYAQHGADLQRPRARSEIFDKAHPRHVVPDGTGLGDPVAQPLIQANDTCVSCLGACANEGHALVAGFVLDCQLQA